MNKRRGGTAVRIAAIVLGAMLLSVTLFACSAKPEDRVRIKVLLLPKFEIGEMSGDFPGEAQYYYEAYVMGGEVFEIPGASGDGRLYVKDGIALFLVGVGKVESALNTAMLLSDARFDFSETYVISTGCAGCAAEYGVMGDVYVISAAVDYDLGHHADPRDLTEASDVTWFREADCDSQAAVLLNAELTERVYSLVKDVPLETTEKTRTFMTKAFPDEAWADRDPRVLRGTSVTGDNYWKGWYDHKNALKIVETYACEDPFAVTEMEDLAVLQTLSRFGLLDRSIVIRDSVNMDVFMMGDTPESLWDTGFSEKATSGNDGESFDIFVTAMQNNFKVGRTIIEAIADGGL